MKLDDIARLCAEATSAPWNYEPERYSSRCVIGIKPRDDRWVAHCQPALNGEANGLFISAARTYLPLLVEVARTGLPILAELKQHGTAPCTVEQVLAFQEALAKLEAHNAK